MCRFKCNVVVIVNIFLLLQRMVLLKEKISQVKGGSPRPLFFGRGGIKIGIRTCGDDCKCMHKSEYLKNGRPVNGDSIV